MSGRLIVTRAETPNELFRSEMESKPENGLKISGVRTTKGPMLMIRTSQPEVFMTPEQARELAILLIRLADEASRL